MGAIVMYILLLAIAIAGLVVFSVHSLRKEQQQQNDKKEINVSSDMNGVRANPVVNYSDDTGNNHSK